MTAFRLLTVLSLLLFCATVAFDQRNTSTLAERPSVSDSHLLETGNTAKVHKPPPPNSEIRIVSYNIRWRGGEELNELIKLFRDDPNIGNATLLGLQEVDRHRKRTNHTNTVKLIARELDFHYAWAAPPVAKSTDEEETGVAILSLYPLSEVTRIVLPNPGPNQRRRVALGATVDIGGTKVRFYSVHGETRISVKKKLEQMEAVLKDLERFPKETPSIILGDLNTWEPDADNKTIELFTAAGFRTPFGGQSTFKRRILFLPLELRLDWIWLRGLEPVSHGVVTKIEISDHWPLWTTLKQPSRAAERKADSK